MPHKSSLGSSPEVFGRLYFLKKQPGHAEFISASHQDDYPIYRQFIAKHIFYFASEMPICIGMTPHFISSEHLWAPTECPLLHGVPPQQMDNFIEAAGGLIIVITLLEPSD
jgi:hypothetical protein